MSRDRPDLGTGSSEPEPLYVFLHLSKTGGTTVEGVLARRFGRRLQRTNPRPGNRQWRRVADPTCYTGHGVLLLLDEIRAHQAVRWITWVRDPLRTALSTYYYARDVLAPMHPPGTFFVDRGLETWLTYDGPRRWPLPDGYGHDRLSKTLRARGFALSDFDFVGVAERFSESMFLLYDALGWTPLCYRTRNRSRSRKTAEERAIAEDPRILARFRELNAQDYAMCREATARLDAARAAYGPGFADDLAHFERALDRRNLIRRIVTENPAVDLLRRSWRTIRNRHLRNREAAASSRA